MSQSQTWTQRAWCPAHITGMFQVDKHHASEYRQGSRGAGLNLALGVTSTVTIDEQGRGLEIKINNAQQRVGNDGRNDAPVVAAAMKRLLGDDYPAHVRVQLTSDVPAGQGFGVSGASALASCVALAQLLRFPIKKAMWEAHRTEIIHKTGLGDVAAQFVGGAEIRVTAGALPMGVVERFAGLEARSAHIICCALDGTLSTASVLNDKQTIARINDIGATCVDQLRQDPTLKEYMRLSRHFTDHIGLTTDALQAALQAADQHAPATQTMLGHALHLATDDEDTAKAAADTLRDHGTVWHTKISARGVHTLRD